MGRTILLVGLWLVGCGVGIPRTLIAPDTYAIRCGAMMSNCEAAARDECPDGFTELERGSVVTGQTIQTQSYGPPEARTTTTRVYDNHSARLVVRCNPPQFCETQQECRAAGLRCVISDRYEGKFVCAE